MVLLSKDYEDNGELAIILQTIILLILTLVVLLFL